MALSQPPQRFHLRYGLRRSAARALAVVGVAAAGAAPAADASPAPAFRDPPARGFALVAVTPELQAGEVGRLVAQVRPGSRCSVSLTGPGGLKAGPYRGTTSKRYLQWRWKTSKRSKGGEWKASVTCRRRNVTLTKRTTILVAATERNDRPAVTKGSLRVSGVQSAPKLTVAADAGKGAGGSYPDGAALCKWTGRRDGKCKNYDWGYRTGNAWSVNSARGFAYRNCTDFVSWYLGIPRAAFRFPGAGHAANWKDVAGNAGLQVTGTPSVGDVAWWGTSRGGGYGHVAVVTAVESGGAVTIAEYNGDGQGTYRVRPNVRAEAYLHRPTAPPAPAPQPTPPPPPPTAAPSGSSTTPAPTVNPAPSTAEKPAPTWAAQQGSNGANTFTNPFNASGMGVKVPAMAWVQVSCKVHAPQIASANPDGYWYRLASSPWNNQYYAVANTFWNGDVPGRKPYTHNTDWAIPNC